MTDNNNNPYGSGFTTNEGGSGFVSESSNSGSGFVSADSQGSGFVSADRQGSGFVSADGQGSGFVSADSQGSGFVSADSNIPGGIASTFTDIQVLSSQGAMSTVYKGKKYGKWHIIKRIKPEFKNNEEYKRLFMQEFDNGIQLDHPNIVRLEDKGEDSDGLWFSMEYVDGRSLDEMIKNHEFEGDRNVLNENLVKNITLQLCDALSYVHKKQIVHRDLKPENIMVTYRGDNVKVLDFGLAHSDSYDDNMKKVGTPKYMAPEQKERGNTVDQRADIYALGLIVNEMCTGTTDIKYAKGIKNLNLQTVIAKSVRKNPQDRYHDCQEIIRDLNAEIKKAPVFEQPEKAEPKKPEESKPQTIEKTDEDDGKKKKFLMIGITAAVVAAGIILAMVFSGNNGGNTADNHNDATNQEQTSRQDPTPDNGEQKLNESLDNIVSDINQQEDERLAKADEAFKTNIPKALELYEEILKDDPNNEKAISGKGSCIKELEQSNLFDMDLKNGQFINENGKIVIDEKFDSKSNINNAAGYELIKNNNIIVMMKNGKMGLVDNKTKKAITGFIYNKIIGVGKNKFRLHKNPTGGKQDYLNLKNDGSYEIEYDKN